MYKYLNPNLIVVTAEGEEASQKDQKRKFSFQCLERLSFSNCRNLFTKSVGVGASESFGCVKFNKVE